MKFFPIGVLQLLQTRTSRRFLQSRLTPDMERKLVFLTSQVRFGYHKRYQEWFQRQVIQNISLGQEEFKSMFLVFRFWEYNMVRKNRTPTAVKILNSCFDGWFVPILWFCLILMMWNSFLKWCIGLNIIKLEKASNGYGWYTSTFSFKEIKF